jgi:hypothetical protein
MAATICTEIEATGYEEYRCRLSGASVEPTCRQLGREPCIPRKARMVRLGALRLDEIPKDERQTVRAMAEQMATATMTGSVRELGDMSDDELYALQKRVLEQRRSRAKAARQRERLLPRLGARRQKLENRIALLVRERDGLDAQIEGLREGRPVEAAVKPRMKRRISPEGRERMRQAGQKHGRHAWTDAEVQRVRTMRAAGKTFVQIGAAMGQSPAGCRQALERAGEKAA